MARRSKAREVVLQMLYQIDVNPDVAAGAVRDMIREQLPDEDLRAFAWSLFAGVRENRGALDSRIAMAAENWSLARMAATDRNALRLGAFELLYTETPHRVVIDETIELAKPLWHSPVAAVRQRHSRQTDPAGETRPGQTGRACARSGSNLKTAITRLN